MPSNEDYQAFLSVFYPLFLITSLLSQTFVIYIIFNHSPKYLQTLRLILFNTCFFQIIHVSTCYIMQLRQVSNMVPIELWSYGPGRYLEAFIGYSLYHVLQSATCISGISVVMTLYLKYEAARVIKLVRWKRIAIIGSLLTPLTISISMEIILVFTTAFPSHIRERYRFLNANVEDHSVVGVLDFKVPATQVNVLVMSSSVFLLPIVGLTSRRKTMQHMNSTVDRLSPAKMTQNKIFVQGLTLQTFLPLFFYIPISSIYFLAAATHIEVLFQQYFMFLIPAFPALFDPYITLYFVTPYRNRIKIWLKVGRPMKSVTLVTSSINSHF